MKVKSNKPLGKIPVMNRLLNGIKKLVTIAASEPIANLFSRGQRVIVNEGSTKEPIYYTAVVTKVSKKDNVVYVAFDDGDKGWYNATRSMVGLVGLAATSRARKVPIPTEHINKWLKTPIGKMKRPEGTLSDDRRKAPIKPGELVKDKALFKKVLNNLLCVNSADVTTRKGVIVLYGADLFKGIITRVYKEQKVCDVKLDNKDKIQVAYTDILTFLTKEQIDEKYPKSLKLSKAFSMFDAGYQYITVNSNVAPSSSSGFSVDDTADNGRSKPAAIPTRNKVYGQLNLDRGENKLYFSGDDITLESKGLPAYFVNVSEVKKLIESAEVFTTVVTLRIGTTTFKVSSLREARDFVKELEKVKKTSTVKTTPKQESDRVTEVYTKWANIMKGGSKTRYGLMLSGNDSITEMANVFKKLKQKSFKELGVYSDASGEIYFLFMNKKEQDTYAVFKSNTNETWSMFIMPKQEYDARFSFMEVNADDFRVTDYVDIRKPKVEGVEKLKQRLSVYNTKDFQNSANNALPILIADLPDSITYFDNKKTGFGLSFKFPSSNERAARNWVRAWATRNNLESYALESKLLDGDKRSTKWLSVTLTWSNTLD